MPDVEIRLRRAGSPIELLRQAFDVKPGEQLVFGRAPDADVTIEDPDRKVSSRHGTIHCESDGSLVATDLGSLNGTFLDGVAVGSGPGTVIPLGSILRVSDYDLEIVECTHAETVRTDDLSLASRSLIRELESAYDDGMSTGTEARATAMQAAIDRAMTKRSRREGKVLMESMLAEHGGFQNVTPVPMSPSIAAPPPPAPVEAPAVASPRESTTTDGIEQAEHALRGLAAELVPGVELDSPASYETFCRLLSQVTKATLDWLAKGLQSRGVFAEEFGAEVTLVFQRSSNPLKTMSQDELRRFLLDWSEATDAETRNYYLEGVLKDLTEHQVGVIAGVKEAVAGIFARLAPARVEAAAKDAPGWSKANKLWNAYQELHRELSEEQTKLFQDLITPAIQKGYLHQHGEDA
ncbi:MAG: FHA domain-containing protein [Planctomycetes bacterium]|nr:FHA domain-containing protein [Planctomycetota bacterium]